MMSNSEPLNAVVLNLQLDNGQSSIYPDPSQTQIIFTSVNWDKARTVTVNAVDDDIDDDLNNETIVTLKAGSNDDKYDEKERNVTVNVIDNDTRGLTISDYTETSVTENGTTTTLKVVLDTQPTAEVTVTPQPADNTEVSVSNPLIFTTSNWNAPQTVTLTGVDDDVIDGDIDTVITLTGSGGDYGSESVTRNVTTQDDDTAGFGVTSVVTVSESGTTQNIIVTLNSKPNNQVKFDVYYDSAGSEISLSTDTLIFDTGNAWKTGLVIEVKGVTDNLLDGDQETNVLISILAGSDAEYIGLDPSSKTV